MSQPFAVLFDFDSTICADESLELLAAHALSDLSDEARVARLSEITAITQAGMNGEITFEDSLHRRLQIFSPSMAHVQMAVDTLRGMLSQSFLELENLWRLTADNLYVVSGGFHEMIAPVLVPYGISEDHIFANTFQLNEQGLITGFDTENPLSRSGGKVEIVRRFFQDTPVIMVGDGMSDHEVSNVGGFIAYEEFVSRQKLEGYPWKAKNFHDVTRLIACYGNQLIMRR